MTLITRLSRFLQADLNAMLDQLEAPELMLKQSIREMQAILGEDEHQLQQLGEQLRQLKQVDAVYQQRLADIESQLDIFFSAQQEDLARLQIRRKLEIQQRLQALDVDQTSVQEAMARLSSDLERKRLQLDSLSEQAEGLLNPVPGRGETGQQCHPDHLRIADDDVEIAFLREQRIRSQS